MAHFSKVIDGIVSEVLVAEQKDIDSGSFGDPSLFVQTSINTRGGIHYAPSDGKVKPWTIPDNGTSVRANYGSPGFIYDKENDVFYEKKPYSSWVISGPDWLWKPPFDIPAAPNVDDGMSAYSWDEDNQTFCFICRPTNQALPDILYNWNKTTSEWEEVSTQSIHSCFTWVAEFNYWADKPMYFFKIFSVIKDKL